MLVEKLLVTVGVADQGWGMFLNLPRETSQW